MSELGKEVLNGLNPQGIFNEMNEIDARNSWEQIYQTNKNWWTNVRSTLVKNLVNVASSFFNEQMENLSNEVNIQINALQGRRIQNIYQVCEFCQWHHFIVDCYKMEF